MIITTSIIQCNQLFLLQTSYKLKLIHVQVIMIFVFFQCVLSNNSKIFASGYSTCRYRPTTTTTAIIARTTTTTSTTRRNVHMQSYSTTTFLLAKQQQQQQIQPTFTVQWQYPQLPHYRQQHTSRTITSLSLFTSESLSLLSFFPIRGGGGSDSSNGSRHYSSSTSSDDIVIDYNNRADNEQLQLQQRRRRIQTLSKIQPPIPYRDETRFVYAGALVNDNNDNIDEIPIRQAETSIEKLVTPSIPIHDPYGWIRDETRTNAITLQYLNNENNYTSEITKHLIDDTSNHTNDDSTTSTTMESTSTSTTTTTLYNELVSYIQETDITVPRANGQYWYYTRTYKGQSYPLYCRLLKVSNTIPTINTIDTTDIEQQQQQSPTTEEEQEATEEIYLNVNELAKNNSYCSIGTVSISPSQQYVAYTIDYTGDETYDIYIKHISTNTIVHTITSTKSKDNENENESELLLLLSDTVEWGNDDTTIYYIGMDDNQRPYKVYQQTINTYDTSPTTTSSSTSSTTNNNIPVVVYEENNDLFWIYLYKSNDKQHLFIDTSSTETSEIHYINLYTSSKDIENDNQLQLHCIAQRQYKVRYTIDHKDTMWYISSNINNTINMALYVSPAISHCQNLWQPVLQNNLNAAAASSTVPSNNNNICFDGGYIRSIDSIECFQNHIVVSGRQDGLPQIWILSPSTTTTDISPAQFVTMEQLTYPESAYDVGLGVNNEYNTTQLTIVYSSLITPTQTIELNMSNITERVILKEKYVPGYNKELYTCLRIPDVPSRDGITKVPISIVVRTDVYNEHIQTKKPIPTHLYGYGAYGICMECDFSSNRLPLLNRGMMYIIAHVRGGSELGRQWYEEPYGGKYLCKMNTFTDFIDVAVWLIEQEKYTTSSLLSCEGRSAGGLLIGACINIRPDLFRVAILGVPFVDVIPTMIDSTIPLTICEWEEWGNPNEEKYFHYMLQYSPTQNIPKIINNNNKQQKYPSCLVTGGLYDPRVHYWEPAKFVAALRYAQAQQQQSTNNDDTITISDNNNKKYDETINFHPICLKIDMSAGHFSASDRYKYLKEKAFDYAFLLDQLGY